MEEKEPEKQKVVKKKANKKQVEFESFKFQNPLADFDDEDIYISDE